MLIAIDPAKPLYLSLAHVGLDSDKVELDLRGANNTPVLVPLIPLGTKDKGVVQISCAIIDGDTGNLGFDDVFTWYPERAKWHGYLEAS